MDSATVALIDALIATHSELVRAIIVASSGMGGKQAVLTALTSLQTQLAQVEGEIRARAS